MENTLIADALYHTLVAGVLGALAWLLIGCLVWAGRILMLVRCMRFVEKRRARSMDRPYRGKRCDPRISASLHLHAARPFYEVRLSGHRLPRDQHDPSEHADRYNTGGFVLRRKGLHICDD